MGGIRRSDQGLIFEDRCLTLELEMTPLKTMTYEVTGRIARITLNRPSRGNGITFEMPQALASGVTSANLERAVHVCAPSGT